MAAGSRPMILAACGELLGGLELALGVDDLCPALALGLGLPGHRALHRLGNLHILDLDGRDLDAPRLGLLVDDLLEGLVEPLALGQAADRDRRRRAPSAASSGRSARSRGRRPRSASTAAAGSTTLEVADRRHPGRNVVASDHLLRRDRQRDGAQLDADHAVHQRQQDHEPGPLHRAAAGPRRKTTARSYSRSTRTLMAAAATATTTRTPSAISIVMPRSGSVTPAAGRPASVGAGWPGEPVDGRRAPGSWRGGRGGRAAASAPASARRPSSPSSSAASGGSWWRAASTTRISAASATMQQRDGAVEAARLGVRPGIQRPDDLAAAVGVGAGLLARAAVADVRLGAVAHQPALVVELVRPEVLALRALPVVVRLVVGEAGGPVAQRAAVRMRRQPLQHERAGHEQAGVAGGQQDLRAHRQPRRGRLFGGDHRGALRLGDLREEDVVGLFERDALDRVADAEVGDVERRERAAGDEHDVAGQAQPLEQRVRVVGQELQLAGLEVARRRPTCRAAGCPSGSSVAKHIQARPMFVDQKLMRAHFSGHLSAGIR